MSSMIQSIIRNWVETGSKIKLGKMTKYRKFIFEMVILNIQPWSVVNEVDFLRHKAPTFEIATNKYKKRLFKVFIR